MRTALPLLLSLLSLLFLPAAGLAAFEGTIEVLQPIVTQEGIDLCTVTYVDYWGTYVPAIRIGRTCSPNLLMTQSGFENRNGASLFSIQASQIQNRADLNGLFGDTLRVNLNLLGLRVDCRYANISPDSVVAATLECIIGNARRDSHVRFLDVQVSSVDPKYVGLSGTWDLDKVAKPARQRHFLSN